MKRIQLALVLASTICLSTVFAKEHERYPVIMWAENDITEVKEHTKPVHMKEIIETLKHPFEGAEAQNMVVVVKEGLTSAELIAHASELEYLKSRITQKAESFTNLVESFDHSQFVHELGKDAITYTVFSLTELNTLAEQLDEEIAKEAPTGKKFIIRVKEQVETSQMDDVLKKVEEVAAKEERKVIMVLAGSKGLKTSSEKLLNLQQTESRVLQATNSTTKVLRDDNTPGIQKMLTPTTLVGLLITGFILFVFIFAILQLFYVQTPTVFVSTSIDFGKIEK